MLDRLLLFGHNRLLRLAVERSVCPIPSDTLLLCAVKGLLETEVFSSLNHNRVLAVVTDLAALLPESYLPDVYLDLPLMSDAFQGISFVLNANDRCYLQHTTGGEYFRRLQIAPLDGVEDAETYRVTTLWGAGEKPEHEIWKGSSQVPDWLRNGLAPGVALRGKLFSQMREAGCPENTIQLLSKACERVHIPFWDAKRGLSAWGIRLDPVGFHPVYRDGKLVDCHVVIRISDRTLAIAGLAFKPSQTVQWHITDECDQRCSHCYLFAENASRPCVSTPYDELIRVLDSFTEYTTAKHLYPMPVISGGDPLLHPDFWRFAEELYRRGLHWRMMGNPFHLDADVCRRLKALGCYRYQMSLDGLQPFHDAMRKPGSFQATLDAVGLLNGAGIKSQLMATVSRQNLGDVLACMDIAVEHRASVFLFARYCATSPKKAAETYPTPEEYRAFLLKYYNKRRRYIEDGCATEFPLKENLFKLLQWELGELNEFQERPATHPAIHRSKGCPLGGSCAILPNGDVMACRRMKSVLGNVKSDNLADIMDSDQCQAYADIAHIQKCGDCELLQVCRGCRAVGYNATGDLKGPDPMCWKE